jgi:hypothetical protein
MDYQSVALGAVVALILATGAAGGAYIAMGGDFGGSAQQAQPSTQTATPAPQQTSQPVETGEVPDSVKDSIPGAKMLKANLSDSEVFGSANVSISKDGEVVVHYTSEAASGPELKSEMAQVALRYANVVGTHNQTGGLTVAANGVKLMVSSDAAVAYDNGNLKTDAFNQTFHWETYKTAETPTESTNE